MNHLKARIFILAAVAAFGSTAVMQGAEQGTFHLLTAARWGSVLLPPGDYKIFLPNPSLEQAELRVEGAGKTVFELPLLTTSEHTSASSYLKLANINGSYFIHEFSSGPSGKKFTFSVPKMRNRQQEAKLADGSLSLEVE